MFCFLASSASRSDKGFIAKGPPKQSGRISGGKAVARVGIRRREDETAADTQARLGSLLDGNPSLGDGGGLGADARLIRVLRLNRRAWPDYAEAGTLG